MFGENSFDIVVSTEMLEHVLDWKTVVSNLKRVLKPNGQLFITTRSFGFRYHAYPYDFWRYEIDDFKNIFMDMTIVKLEKDTDAPGVLLKAIKPKDFNEKDLTDIGLYEIVLNRKMKSLSLESKDFKSKMKVIVRHENNKKKRRMRKMKGRALTNQINNFFATVFHK